MNKKIVLLRVGIDSGCGGIQSPLFDHGTFDFVCIPDRDKVGKQTYGRTTGRDGRPLSNYFSPSRMAMMSRQSIHMDPEFETFTYGDPKSLKKSLRELRSGDLIVFYLGLQRWSEKNGFDRRHRPALYLLGYFDVSLAGVASNFSNQLLKREFASNFHVRHPTLFKWQRNGLVLIKGGPSSRIYRRAHQISEDGVDRAGRRLKILSAKMQRVFGTLSGVGSLQRCVPRWIEPRFVKRACDYLERLE